MNKLFFLKKLFWLSVTIITLFTMCQDKDEHNDFIIDEPPYQPVSIQPISGLRLSWDHSSLTQLSETGSYPKMIRLADSTLITFYEEDGNIYFRQSQDNGFSWGENRVLFPKSTHKGIDGPYEITYMDLMSQPTMIQLQNGDILAACGVTYSYELTVGGKKEVTEFPAAIFLRHIDTSGDMGPIIEVYNNLGCGSPSLLELPDGTIHLYFTNGISPISIKMMNSTNLNITTLDEQRVEMISSTDGGHTWSSWIREFGPDGEDEMWVGAKIIASRHKKINNSPSASMVSDEIVVALSDNKTIAFKPYTVRTPIQDNWSYPINGDTKDRHYAFHEIVPEQHNMSNPDLLVLSTGETLLGYETNGNRFENCETMEVAIGDNRAMNFEKFTRPFPFSNTNNAINNSLFQIDDNTILAMTSSNANKINETVTAPWSIKGYLINDLVIKSKEITEYPIFIGSKSDANIRVGLGIDDANLYVNVKATDDTPVLAEAGSQKGDGVYLYIDAANLSLLDVDTGISKLWVSSEGDVTRWDGKEGKWILVSADGINATPSVTENGYSLQIAIPTSKLTNFNASGIRFGVGLSNYVDSENGTIELLSHCKDLRSSSWLGVTF